MRSTCNTLSNSIKANVTLTHSTLRNPELGVLHAGQCCWPPSCVRRSARRAMVRARGRSERCALSDASAAAEPIDSCHSSIHHAIFCHRAASTLLLRQAGDKRSVEADAGSVDGVTGKPRLSQGCLNGAMRWAQLHARHTGCHVVSVTGWAPSRIARQRRVRMSRESSRHTAGRQLGSQGRAEIASGRLV